MYLRDALIRAPGLDLAEKLMALDAVKRAICPCFEVCDRGVDLILATARQP